MFQSDSRLQRRRRDCVFVQDGGCWGFDYDPLRLLYRMPLRAQQTVGSAMHAREPNVGEELFYNVDV